MTWLENLSFVNYAFEALLINEFLDAGTFYFTRSSRTRSRVHSPRILPILSGCQLVEKEVLNFFSFGTAHEVMMYDVTILLGIMTAYLTLAFILLKISQRDAMY